MAKHIAMSIFKNIFGGPPFPILLLVNLYVSFRTEKMFHKVQQPPVQISHFKHFGNELLLYTLWANHFWLFLYIN